MSSFRLTQKQVSDYAAAGFLIGLPPVYSVETVQKMRLELAELSRLLEPGEKMQNMREWHAKSRWLYDICANPLILDYVEGVLGPNFYVWGTQFFAKEPHTRDTVAWHQDAYYWSLTPHHSVTVWLAFTDVNEENGAMQVIPGTHNKGLIQHRKTISSSVLTLELESGTFNEADAVSLSLRAGEVSLHDDNIVHGSPANPSERWRIGLAIRYSPTNVMSNPPLRFAYLMRGRDDFHFQSYGTMPTEKYGRLPRNLYANDETNRPNS